MPTCVAVDVGSNGGVLYGGTLDDGLDVRETYSFNNEPIERDGRYVWDIEHIVGELVTGLEVTERKVGEIDTIGVDTTGCDFGFVSDGELLRNPTFYRDPDLTSTLPEIFERVTRREVFMATGLAHWHVPNTLYQYHYKYNQYPELFEAADVMVNLPQVITTVLGGDPTPDGSIVSTTQMYHVGNGDWATSLLGKLDLPTDILPTVVEPGTSLGRLSEEYTSRLESDPELLATTGHDTASAVAGTPLASGDTLFLSTGSWLLPGVELNEPVITEEALDIEGSNEIGVEGTIRFLKDVTGFNLFELCRNAWREAGECHEYDALVTAARDARPNGPIFDPDADRFSSGTLDGDVITKIEAYCRETDQPVPSGRGEITRCVFESLAAKCAYSFEQIDGVAPETGTKLNLVGGGVKNELFCEMVASATRRPVVAGPIEATAIGNLLVQLSAKSELDDIAEGRSLLGEAIDIQTYEPRGDQDAWMDIVERMAALVG